MTVLSIKAPFQSSCAIKTNCDNLVLLLHLKYGKYILEEPATADINITVMKTAQTYIISYRDKEYETGCPIQEIDSILFEDTKYDENVFALHGAAVEYGGKAYLFLASTTSGKTTLASYLSSNGFGYITDDCILLNRTSFSVYPYNTPIHLRDGGVEVLKKLGVLPENLECLNEAAARRYIYTPENCITTVLPLERIFFISRTESENNIVSMTFSERMAELMKSPITQYTVTSDYIKFISRLAKIDCSRLFYSDMNYVAKIIKF